METFEQTASSLARRRFLVKFKKTFWCTNVHEALEECKGAVASTRHKRSGSAVDMKPLKVLAGVQKPPWWHVTDTEAVWLCVCYRNSDAATAFASPSHVLVCVFLFGGDLPSLCLLVRWWSTEFIQKHNNSPNKHAVVSLLLNLYLDFHSSKKTY